MDSVQLSTADGHVLAGDLLHADGSRRGGVVVCHPHPRYGGNRRHPIVDAVFRHLADAGFSTLRFDFRAAFDDGVGERLDVISALDELDSRGIAPRFAVGYSFGGAVVLGVADDRIEAAVAIAPPLTMMSVEPPTVPTLVLMPRHDQFTTIGDATVAVAGWPHGELRIVESADHFLVGSAAHVATLTRDWLLESDRR